MKLSFSALRATLGAAVLLLTTLLLPCPLRAADITWSYAGGSPLASNPANWIGGVAPGNGDDPVFGPATPSASCTWDLSVELSSFTITGAYTGTITLQTVIQVDGDVASSLPAAATLDLAGQGIAVGGNLTANGLSIISSVVGSSIAFVGGNAAVASKSDGPLHFENLVAAKNAGSAVSFASNVRVDGSFTVQNGTVTVPGGLFQVGGAVTENGGYMDFSAATLVLFGNQPQVVSAPNGWQISSIGHLYVQNPTVTTLPGIGYQVLLDTTPYSTLQFDLVNTAYIGSLTLTGANASKPVLVTSPQPGTQTLIALEGAASVSYAFVQDSNASGGNTIATTNSTSGGDNANWTIAGVATSTRIWSWSGGAPNASLNSNWFGGVAPEAGSYVVFGATTPNAPCLWDLPVAVSSMVFAAGYNSTVSLATQLQIGGSLGGTAGGAATLDLLGQGVGIGSNLTATGLSIVSSVVGSSVVFFGAVPAVARKADGPLHFENLVGLKDAGSAVAFSTSVHVDGGFTVQNGTVAFPGGALQIAGAITQNGGYIDFSAATVYLTGNSAQVVSAPSGWYGSVLANLVVQNPSVITLPGIHYGVVMDTTPYSTLQFDLVNTAYIGTLTLTGTGPSSPVLVTSPQTGTQTLIALTGSANVNYAFVQDSNAAAGNTIATSNSTSGGDNANWTIAGVATSTRIWSWSGGAPNASLNSNWLGGVAPENGSYVVFGATTPNAPCLWDLPVALSSMTFAAGYDATVLLATQLQIAGSLSGASGGTATLDLAGQGLGIGSGLNATGLTIISSVVGSSVVFFGAPSGVASKADGPLHFENFIGAKNAGSPVAFASNVRVDGSFTVQSGTVSFPTSALQLGGAFTENGGYVDLSAGTLILGGTQPQQVSAPNGGQISTIATLDVQNAQGANLPSIQYGVLLDTIPSSQLFLQAGSLTQVSTLTISGASLLSTSPGNQAQFLVTSTATVLLAFIQDNDNVGGPALVASASTDGGDNTNWNITNGVQRVWSYAGGSPLASNPANWIGGVAPQPGDYVLFGANTPTAPATWDLPIQVSSFSISGPYAATVTLSTGLFSADGIRMDAAAGALDPAGQLIRDGGDWHAYPSSLVSVSFSSAVAASTVAFNGGSHQSLYSLGSGPLSFGNVIVDGSSSTAVRSGLSLKGALEIDAGTLYAGANQITLGGDLRLDAGVFTMSRATFVFAGAAPQQIVDPGVASLTQMQALYVQNPTKVTVRGVSIDVFVATSAPANVAFDSSLSTVTVSSFNVSGANLGNLINLTSVQSGTPAFLAVTSTESVNFAYVQDLDAAPGLAMYALNSTDGGDNTHWIFTGGIPRLVSALFSTVSSSSATLTWTSTLPAGTTYDALISTGPFPNSFAGNQSSSTLNVSALFTGLSVNASYYAEISTGSVGGPYVYASTVTSAVAPTAGAVTAVYISSVALTWNTAGDPPGTAFAAQASVDDFATVEASSQVVGGAATVSGLIANTTYYLRVGAVNLAGSAVFTSAITTVTLTAPPTPGAPPVVTATTVLVSWSTTDPAYTLYDVDISTNGFGTLVNSTAVTATSALFSGLSTDTTYQLQVRAVSMAGVPTAWVSLTTATTLLPPPGTAATSFPAVGVSSVSAAWTTGGNGAGTVYSADLSTDAFATVNFTSSTQNLSALFGTGGAGPALFPNTTYYVRVQAHSGGDSSSYTLLGSTSTLPAVPVAAAASDVETSSGTWTWGADGNSAGTSYLVELSTNSFVTLDQSAVAAPGPYVFNGLTANTTYQFRVATIGYDGYVTGFAGAASSATLPTPPSPTGLAVFASSASTTWTTSDPPPELYALQASTNGFATVSVSSATPGFSALLTTLIPNTTYSLRVRATGVSGAAAYSGSIATTTWALPPASVAFIVTSTGSLLATWGSAGNPSGTFYEADISLDGFLTVLQSSVTAALNAPFAGLTSNTTFYLRVFAINSAGVDTTYSSGGSTGTAAAIPTAQPLNPGPTDVLTSWGDGGNPVGTAFLVEASTNGFATLVASSATELSGYDFTGLETNTTYSFRVAALAWSGTPSAFLALGTTQTLLLTPGAPAQPFLDVGLSSAVVAWTNGGNGPSVVYQADVSTDGFATVNLTSATASLSAWFGTGGFGPALTPDTTYWFRVRATGSGNISAYVALGSTATYAATPSAPAATAASTTTLTLSWAANGNPATSVYLAQDSSTTFATILATAQGAVLTQTFSGLLPDATYELRVQTVGIDGPTGFVSVSTWTAPAAPTNVVASAVATTTVAVTWNAIDAPGSPYLVNLSTTGFPSIYASTTVLVGSAVFAGVPANTTYYAEVESFAPDGTGPGFVLAAATATPAAAPTSLTLSGGIGATTATWTWGIGPNGPTTYEIEVSTFSNFSLLEQTQLVSASSAAGAAALFSGLTANTTQYARVLALGFSGPSASTSAPLAVTLAAAPTPLPLIAVGTGAVVAAWGANGDAPTTIFDLRVSTNGFATYNTEVLVSSTQGGIGGLLSDTSYSFEVRALGIDGPSAFVLLPSTSTLPASPGVPASPFLAVGVSSVSVSWTTGGNGPGTVYEANVSTNGFVTFDVSSFTANLSAVFGLGGAGALTPDTTYEFRVAATSGSTLSPEVVLGSTGTLAADPLAPAASASALNSLTYAWGADGNPSDTHYASLLSTNGFVTINQSSAPNSTAATFVGLVPNSTYYFEVRAISRGGAANAYVVAATTYTPAAAPLAAVGAYGLTTATLTWSADGNPATTLYEAQISTNGFVTFNASSVTQNTSAGFSGLAPDTTYYLRVEALGLDGATTFAVAAASATIAAAPTGASAGALGVSSVTVSWSASGDPAGTIFEADLSTNSFATLNASSFTLNSPASFTGLQANATYYLRVAAQQWDGGLSAEDVAGTTVTYAAFPASLPLVSVGSGSIVAAWGANGNAAGTGYDVRISTNGFATYNSEVVTNALSAGFGGLLADQGYALEVRALGVDGPSGFVLLPSTVTLPAVPGVPASPFLAVGVSSVSVSWTTGGNGPGTVYEADISTNGFVTFDVSSFTANLSAVFGLGGAGALTPDTTYEFRVAATSGSALSAEAILGSTGTLASDPLAPAASASALNSLTYAWGADGNPSDTHYASLLSTNNFTTINQSSAPNSTAATFVGLVPNSTYYFEVRAISREGAANAYVVAAATYTPAAAPAAAVGAYGLTTATLTWSADGNPATTLYEAQISTNGFVTLNASSVTQNTSAGFAGLAPDTTYYLRVEALGLDGATAFAVAAASATAAAAPTAAAAAPLGVSSVTVSWSADGNAAGTVFRADLSTNAFATLDASSFTLNTSAAFTGLQANATYYLRVAAQQWDGALSVYAVAGATATLAAAPASLPLVSVGSGSVVAAWGANGDAAGTTYDLRISTNGFLTYNSEVFTNSLTAGFGGLVSDTAYALEVRALGIDGPSAFVLLPSTVTLPALPGVPASPFLAVGVSSVSVSWTSGGNGAGTVYEADVSTNNFATFNVSSFTANLSAVFGLGGAGALTPDTTYQFRVAATSGATVGGEVVLGSTGTLAADPLAPAASASALNSLTYAWGADGNPGDTRYGAVLSTNGFVTVNQSSAPNTPGATFSGLVPDTTYYLEVRAISREGAANAYVVAPTTYTPAAVPGAAAGAYALTTATLTWSADGNPATTVYEAQLSTNDFLTLNAVRIGTGTSAGFAGLAPDTTYYLQVQALGLAGATPFAVATASATAAAAPAGAAAAPLGVSSATISWSANGNAAGTVFRADLSTNAFATLDVSSFTLNASAAFAGLQANATYYLRVAAQQWDGGLSAEDVAGATVTFAAVPASLPLVSVGSGSIVAAWGANGNAAGTGYDVRISTNGFATYNSEVVTNALSAGFGGLLSAAAYSLEVRALGVDGPSAFVLLPSTTTLPASPGVPASPFLAVGVSSVSVSWTTGGNGPGTVYEADISTNGFVTFDVSSFTANLSAVFGLGGAGALTPDTTYEFRVAATSGSTLSPEVVLGSTGTLAADPLAPAASASALNSLTYAWGADGNPSDTHYASLLSTNGFVTINQSSAPNSTAATFVGLVPNSTYYFEVRAISRGGAANAYVVAATTYTPAAAPLAAVGAYGLTTATLTWSADGNPATTLYEAQISTNGFVTFNASSVTMNTSAAFAGLAANTTYYFQVQALGLAGATPFAVATASATPAAPPTGAAAAPLGVSSATLSWSADGNAAETVFRADLSTNAFATLDASSFTLNTSAAFTGLQANATYYLRVAAQQWDGALSAEAVAGATVTPAALPAALPLVSVGTGAVVAAWGANGDAAGTTYDLRVSTNGFATYNSEVFTTAVTAGFGGLQSNASYELEVRALGVDGPTAFVALPSTTTVASGPGVPAQPFLAVGVSSVAVAWTSGGNDPGTIYEADVSTNGFATVNFSSFTANLSAVFGLGGAGALTPDTTYEFRVAATSGAELSAEAVLGSTGTLAADPLAPAASASALNSLSDAWGADGNPSDTHYVAQLSTNAFATINQSSSVFATGASFSGLVPNTTYDMEVRAISREGAADAYVVAAATYTPAAAPAAAVGAYGLTTATLTWSADGNPATTLYEAQISTNDFATLNASSATLNTSAAFAGLAPNTTYYLQVQALGLAGPTPFAVASAGATAAAAPAGATALALGVSSVSVSWSANGDPAGTTFKADLSTNAFATLNASSVTLNASAAFAGLQPNTTYYQRVEAIGWDGAASAYSVAAATATAPATPLAAAFTAVGATALIANWTADGNPAGTLYLAQISTNSFATLVQSSATANVFASFAGLTPATTYQVQVLALGYDGTATPFAALGSTQTYLLSPGAAAAPFSGLSTTSLTAAWTTGGNPGGTEYRADLSTDAFATLVQSSTTLNLTATFAGLTPDTTYAARVEAQSGTSDSLFLAIGTTATWPAPPTAPAFAVGATTAALSWASDGNPATTQYRADFSTNGFATVSLSSAVAALSAAVSGLVADTTYFARVLAVGRGGSLSAYAGPVSTPTQAELPLSPAFVPLGVSSAALSWASDGNPATTLYAAQASSDAFADVAFSTAVRALASVAAGLTPNTTYQLAVSALGADGETVGPSFSALTVTPPAPPSGASIAVLGTSSAAVSWAADGDPAGTTYAAELSTDSFATVLQTSGTVALSATFTGLTANATYYARVQTIGWSGATSAFDVLAATATPAAAPAAAPLVAVGSGSIVAAWGADGNAATTTYDVRLSTNGFATFNAEVFTSSTQAGFGGLFADTNYELEVRALGIVGPTAFVALPSTTTTPSVPGLPAQPIAAVGISSVAVAWTTGGNGPGTIYEADVSTNGFATLNASSFTANVNALFGLGGLGSLSPDTTYEFRVAATSGAELSAETVLGSTGTLAADPLAPAATASSTGSLTYAWGADGNPGDTHYVAQLSTNNFVTVNQSSSVFATGAAFAALVPDSTYYFEVRAISREGAANAYVAAASTHTPAAAPTAPVAAYGLTTATLTWSADGNPATTVYEAQLSTNDFATLNAIRVGTGTGAAFAGLAPNTTYYLQVEALGLDGATAFAVAAASATAAAAPTGAAATALGVSSVTLAWSANGDPAGTRFEADLSTNAFATLNASSVTLNASAVFVGLQANATYYLRVSALQWDGSEGAADAAAPTTTPAAPPAPLAPVSVGSATVTAAWGANGDAAGTTYDVRDSTNGFATYDAELFTSSTQAVFAGLLSDTSYAFEVRALGVGGPTAFVALPSTATLPASPGLPASPFAAVGLSSVAVSWTNGGNGPGTVYEADVSTNGFLTFNVSSFTANLSAVFGLGGAGTLTPDATYEFRVAATSGATLSPEVVLGSTGTLAADPTAPAATTSSTTALTYAWGADGNPSDTHYVSLLSTNAFVTVSQSASVFAAGASFSGLVPNSTYYFEVRAISREGAASVYVVAAATYTPAAAPSAAVAAFGVNTATLTWSASGNPAATIYEAQLSTNGFVTLNAIDVGTGTSAAFSGLAPNTTYYLQVQALGLDGTTPFAVAAASATTAAPPTGATAAALGVSSVAVNWSANGDPAGTLFEADLSTNDFATLNASSVTLNTSATFAGLQANATYWLRASALQWDGTPGPADAAAPVVTPAAIPAPLAPVAVGSGSVVAAWGANGDAAGTTYDLRVSTNGFATFNAEVFTSSTQAGFGGLIPNSDYEFEVRALGVDGPSAFAALPTVTTLLLPPAAAATPFPSVGVSSVTLAWTSGGNSAGTTYDAQISTDNFNTIVIGSVTANLTVLFGTGGAGASLPVDELYEARVFTVNGSSQSAYVSLGSTSTFADAPSASALVAVTSQTVSLAWSANGNPAGAVYQVQDDVTPAFAAPTTLTVSTNDALVASLAMGATYYFRVRALSAAGAPTGYDVTLSTATLPPAPTQPGPPTPATLGVSSLSWTWSAATFASSYRLYSDSAASVLLNVQSSATFVETALGSNASSYLVVVGVDASGPGPESAVGLGWTLAAPPMALTASAVYGSSATVSWALNGDPAYTGAEVQRSLDGVTYAVAAASAPVVSFIDNSLESCTTYYYRVRDYNGAGVPTAFAGPIFFMTAASTPTAPSGFAAAPLAGDRISLTWTPSSSPDAASYQLYWDAGTGVVNYATSFSTFSSGVTSYVTPPLVSSAAYTFALRATNLCGIQDKNTTTRAASPAVLVPGSLTAVVVSPPSGRHVYGNRVTFGAVLSNGQLANVSQVALQYSPSGAGAWTNAVSAMATHQNPAAAAPYYVQWDVTGLAAGSYDVRAVAYNLSGSSDPAPVSVTFVVDPVAADVLENDLGGGHSQRTQAVFADVDNAVVAGGEGATDPLAQLLLPSGALATSTATLAFVANPSLGSISTAPAGGTGVGLFASLALSNGQSALAGGRAAGITLSYLDPSNDGIVEGTGVEVTNLRFYSYNTLTSAWQEDLTTTFDSAARTVTGETPHFTLFGAFGAAPATTAATLDSLRIYPVPFRPNGPNPDEGRPYVAGNLATGIIFDNLPTTARVRIFTIDGRLVADLNNNGSSTLQWNVKNDAGRDVASGGYFAVITSPGLATVTRAIAIIR